MAGKIPQAFIHELIARIDLVDLIDARVPLKKSGANFTARCPFHSEKTPSFSVNRDKQFYHCFGCGAHGNALGFLMEYERLSFPEAVAALAVELGLPVPYDGGGAPASDSDGADLQSLYDVQEQAARFYARQFKAHPAGGRAAQYLMDRGITGESAKLYRLGYAPPGWRSLPDQLPQSALEACGLAIRNQDGYYDRFRDRVMFPIRDRRGRVIGFGGRVLGDEKPKYLNSPETPVFTKHREVYGLYELLKVVRKPERILVVEGYMDVISLAQHGIPFAVATLGTATSEDHIHLLFRYTDELVFCFDGDAAGTSAAWKALNAALPALRDGKKVCFLTLPRGHDPDTLIRDEGTEGFQRRIGAAAVLSDYFFQRLVEDGGLSSLEGKATLQKRAEPLLERLPPGTLRNLMLARLAELTGVETASPKKSATLNRNSVRADSSNERPSLVRTILALLIQRPGLARFVDGAIRQQLRETPKLSSLSDTLFELIERQPDLSLGGILEGFRGTADENRIRVLGSWDIPEEHIEQVFCDALARYRESAREQKLARLLNKSRVDTLSQDEREELAKLLRERPL
ncbi:MAG: DNA primase [Methylococcaceae bacterium]|nr:DNA primase [Methylococcaceae bacterium]